MPSLTGLEFFFAAYPGLKSWATIIRPFGAGSRMSFVLLCVRGDLCVLCGSWSFRVVPTGLESFFVCLPRTSVLGYHRSSLRD